MEILLTTSTKIVVRLTSSPDHNNDYAIDIASEINNKYFKGCSPPKFKEDYLWLGFVGSDVAGFATLRPFHEHKFSFLERVAVLDKYRGRGLQKKFISARLRLSKRIGINTVITYTVLDNPASSNSLIRRGFSLYSPEWKWAGDSMLYFIKHLGK